MFSFVKNLLVTFLSSGKNGAKHFHWQGNDFYELKIVGTSYCRESIQKITNTELGKSVFFCKATLVPEDNNKYDKNAIKVVIANQKVGYVSSDFAITYREYFRRFNIPVQNITCNAAITGGLSSVERNYEFIIELDLPNPPLPPVAVVSSNENTHKKESNFSFRSCENGTYQIDSWLDYYAIADIHPKKRIHTWTTDEWDTINYYLLNRKGIGLGHKLFSIKKTEHYRLFGNSFPKAEVSSINGRIAQITLKAK